jgi:hypothetical protein
MAYFFSHNMGALSGKQVMSASSSLPKYTLHPNGG